MAWPQSHDFQDAVLNPESSFRDADLRTATVVKDARGLPIPASGQFGIVYQMVGAKGKRWAVKCFTADVPGRAERYRKIAAHLQTADLPFIVGFDYLDQGVYIQGSWYPILKMDWVEGQTLNRFIADRLEQPGIIRYLTEMWPRVSKNLRDAQVTHADLQHGNIMLVPGKAENRVSLKLVDYDGMYLPSLAGTQSGEMGHPCYQHPRRLAEGLYTAQVDRFSHLVIYTTLRALQARGRGLWQTHNYGDNLLFMQADFQAPKESKVLRELWEQGPEDVRALTGRLILATEQPLEQIPELEDVMVGSAIKALTKEQTRAVDRILGVADLSAPTPAPTPVAGTKTDPAKPKTQPRGTGTARRAAQSDGVLAKMRAQPAPWIAAGAAVLIVAIGLLAVGTWGIVQLFRTPNEVVVTPPPQPTAPPNPVEVGEKQAEWLETSYGDWAIYRFKGGAGALFVSQDGKQLIYVPSASDATIIQHLNGDAWRSLGIKGEEGSATFEDLKVADYLPPARQRPGKLLANGKRDFTNWKVEVDDRQIVLVNATGKQPVTLTIPRNSPEFVFAGNKYGLPAINSAQTKAGWADTQFGDWSIFQTDDDVPCALLVNRKSNQVLHLKSTLPKWVHHRDRAGTWRYVFSEGNNLAISGDPPPVGKYLATPEPKLEPAKGTYTFKDWKITVGDERIDFEGPADSGPASLVIYRSRGDVFSYAKATYDAALEEATPPGGGGPQPSTGWLNARFGDWSIFPADDDPTRVLLVANNGQAICISCDNVDYVWHCDAVSQWRSVPEKGAVEKTNNLGFLGIDKYFKRAIPKNDAAKGVYKFKRWSVTVTDNQVVLQPSDLNVPGRMVILERKANQFIYAGRTFGPAGNDLAKGPVDPPVGGTTVKDGWINTRFGDWSLLASREISDWPGVFVVSSKPRHAFQLNTGSVGWIYHWDENEQCRLLLDPTSKATQHNQFNAAIGKYMQTPVPKTTTPKGVYQMKPWTVTVGDDDIEFRHSSGRAIVITRKGDEFHYGGQAYSPTLAKGGGGGGAEPPIPVKMPPKGKDKIAIAEGRKLEGTWAIGQTRVIFKEGRFTQESFGSKQLSGTFEVKPAAGGAPAALEITVTDGADKGKTAETIYRFIDDDRLELILPKVGQAKPANFAAAKPLEFQREGRMPLGKAGAGGVMWTKTGRILGAGKIEYWDIRLEANKTYVFHMKQAANSIIDPCMELRDGKNASIIVDDGTGNDSQIVFTPTQTGNYRIRCGGYNGTTGSFTLTLSRD